MKINFEITYEEGDREANLKEKMVKAEEAAEILSQIVDHLRGKKGRLKLRSSCQRPDLCRFAFTVTAPRPSS
jgi:hypothetical protein